MITEFEENRGETIRLTDLTKAGKQCLLRQKKYWHKFQRDFAEWLYKRGVNDNCVGLVFKMLRTLFNYIEKERGINTGGLQRLFVVPREEVPIVVFTPMQLQQLIAMKEGVLDGRMQLIKICLYLAVRWL